ncbi:MAG TPA: TrbI/VirB10 family protein [Planctomycetota bacterium]|nr:TrbI/VirB10 family protein [Planctomycetota bacterium]
MTSPKHPDPTNPADPSLADQATQRDDASATGADGVDLAADERTAGAAERALGGGGRFGREIGRDKDKKVLVLAVVGGAALIAIAGIAMLASRKDAQPQAKVYTPRFDVAMSSQEELRSFTKKTSQEVTDLSARIADLTKAIDAMGKRQDNQDEQLDAALREAAADLERAAAEKLKAMEEVAKLQRVGGLGEDPRLRGTLDEFRRALATAAVSPAEARARAITALRAAGLSDDRIRDLLAEAAQQAGRIEVGDIAEPAMSAAEIATAPTWVQPLLPEARELLYGLALNEGRFYPDQGIADLRQMLSTKDRIRAKALTDEQLKAIASIARVRRDNLPPEIEEHLSFLIATRDQRAIANADRDGIARLVWSERERYDDATPGQMLSLCHVVARTVDAVAAKPGEADAFKPIDATASQLAGEVVATAVFNAIQLGKDQAQQHEIANRALANYLDTARLSADDAARAAIITRAMASAAKRREAQAAAKQSEKKAEAAVEKSAEKPGDGAAPSGADAPNADVNRLFFGPVAIDRGRVAQALMLSAPGMLQANGIDPATAAGAAALVSAWEQVPRIVAETLPGYLGAPMGGREFGAAALPQVIWALRMGQKLGAIELPIGAGGSAPDRALMQGAAVGAIYGPFLDDEDKAKSAAIDAARALEAEPPLTPAVVARLARVPVERPYERIAIAYEALRPGRGAWSPERFHALAGVTARLTAAARPLAQALSGRFGDGQDGLFEENVRLLVPLAVAAHDDGRLEPERVMAAARDDLRAYAVLFAAESTLSLRVRDELLPRYALAAGEDGSSGLVAAASTLVPAVVQELWRARRPRLADEELATIADALAEEAAPLVESRLVQEAVLTRVEPRLRRSAGLADGALIDQALRRARERARDLVQTPYTPARIDNWATTITEECRGLIAGREPRSAGAGGAPGASAANGQRRGATNSLWPAPTMIAVTNGGTLVGGREHLVRTRKVVIPANSYANAHLQTGVDAEIGGKGNVPVMLQVDFDWVGPANSRLQMRGCRLSGYANALAGPERISVDLKTLSYVFPSGRETSAKVDGYISDNIHGQYGALGVYKWNLQKVMPLAVMAGGFEGAADALKANSTTTIVTESGATATALEGSQLEQALYGGVSNGFGIMSSYFQDTLKEVRPSVSVVNGQRVSIVLLDPVVLDVPEDEFSHLVKGAVGSFSP